MFLELKKKIYIPQLLVHTHAHTSAHTLFERSIRACLPWMRAHPSVDRRQYTSSVFLCKYLNFRVADSVCACVCVCPCLQAMARWTSRSSWRYWGPNCCRQTIEKDSWATPSTTSSGRWGTKRPRPSWHRSCFSSLTLFIIYLFHPLLLLLLTYLLTPAHLWLCISGVRAGLTSLSTAQVTAGSLHSLTPT